MYASPTVPSIFRILVGVFLTAICTTGTVSAIDLVEVQAGLSESARLFTKVLPLNGTVGLSGGRPFEGREFRGRFVTPTIPVVAAGVSVGATFLPFSYVTGLFDTLSLDDPTESLAETGLPGVPLPAYAAELRVGAPLFPFEIGTKYSFVPEEARELLPDEITTLDYSSIGFDVRARTGRYALNHISRQAIGFSYTYFRGAVGGQSGQDFELGEYEYFPGDPSRKVAAGLTDVAAAIGWKSHSAEVHWSIGTRHGPVEGYAGTAVGGGLSQFSFALDSELTLSEGGVAVPDSIRTLVIDGVEQIYPDVSLSPSLDAGSDWLAGWYVRGFGGIAVVVRPVSLGLGLSYAVLPGAWTITATTTVRL